MKSDVILVLNRKVASLMKSQESCSITKLLPQYVSLENLEDDFIFLKPAVDSTYPVYTTSVGSKVTRRAEFLNGVKDYNALDTRYADYLTNLRIEIVNSISDFKSVQISLPTHHNSQLIDAVYPKSNDNAQLTFKGVLPKVYSCSNLNVEAELIAKLYTDNPNTVMVINNRDLQKAIVRALERRGRYISKFHKLSHFPVFDLFVSITELLDNYQTDEDFENVLLHPNCKYHLYRNQLSPLDRNGNSIQRIITELTKDEVFGKFVFSCRRGKYTSFETLIKSAVYFFEKFLYADSCEFFLKNQVANFLADLSAQEFNCKKVHNIKEVLTFLAADYTIKEEAQESVRIYSVSELEYIPHSLEIIFSDSSFNKELDLDKRSNTFQKFIYTDLLARNGVVITYSENVDSESFSKSAPLIHLLNHCSVVQVKHDEIDAPNKVNNPVIISSKFPNSLSVTAIEKLMRSPYVFAVEYILGIKNRRNIFERNYKIDFGEYIHKALECVDFKMDLSTMKAQFSDALLRLMPTSFTDFEKLAITLEIPRFVALLDKLGLEYMKEDLKEYKLDMMLDEVQTRITARADLIVSGDDLHIIDYKTGTLPTIGEIEAGLFPQLTIEDMILNTEGAKKSYVAFSLSESYVREVKLESDNVYAELVSLISQFKQNAACYYCMLHKIDDPKVGAFKHLLRAE